MNPDELRAHADLIAERYNIQDGDAALWRAMVHVVQAARNLADVIEYAEAETRREGARWAGRRTFARDVLNRLRGDFHILGETNEREKPWKG